MYAPNDPGGAEVPAFIAHGTDEELNQPEATDFDQDLLRIPVSHELCISPDAFHGAGLLNSSCSDGGTVWSRTRDFFATYVGPLPQ